MKVLGSREHSFGLARFDIHCDKLPIYRTNVRGHGALEADDTMDDTCTMDDTHDDTHVIDTMDIAMTPLLLHAGAPLNPSHLNNMRLLTLSSTRREDSLPLMERGLLKRPCSSPSQRATFPSAPLLPSSIRIFPLPTESSTWTI